MTDRLPAPPDDDPDMTPWQWAETLGAWVRYGIPKPYGIRQVWGVKDE